MAKKKATEEGITHRVLYKSDNNNLNELLELYNEDRYKARVVSYHQPKTLDITEIVLFEHLNGNFEIKEFIVKTRINSKNIKCTYRKCVEGIVYSDGKFWRISNTKVFALTFGLMSFNMYVNDFILSYFKERFPWVRSIQESDNICKRLSFTTINKHKLYSKHLRRKYVFNNLPMNVINILLKSTFFISSDYNKNRKSLNKFIGYFDNFLSIRVEMLDSVYLIDTIRMGVILDKKINCKWSLKRLENEHNQWSREINSIILSTLKEEVLNIDDIFYEFESYSGYRMLKTNLELVSEGISQGHCVGSYVSKFNIESIAIYHIQGYTLELAITTSIDNGGYKIFIKQFKGKNNINAPIELMDMLYDSVKEFNLWFMSTYTLGVESYKNVGKGLQVNII
jgi:hypothetical protein